MAASGSGFVRGSGNELMTAEEKRLRALGAAFRTALKVNDDMSPEMQALMLRLLLGENEERPERKRVRA